jgi:hypothetical protein
MAFSLPGSLSLSTPRRGIILYYTESTRLSVPSSELGPATLSPPSECISSLGPTGGSNTALRVRGWGPHSDEGTESQAICILCATQYSVYYFTGAGSPAFAIGGEGGGGGGGRAVDPNHMTAKKPGILCHCHDVEQPRAKNFLLIISAILFNHKPVAAI